jgi:hypothetical protein
MIALEPADMELYASKTEAAASFAPACREAIQTAAAHTGSGHKKTPSK